MGKARVLVVDDELDVVQFIERALKDEQMEVICAYDGLSALDLAEMERPDVIVLDIMMPMMSGYEVAEQLKANPQTHHIPILCLTSAHTLDARIRCRQVGASTVILKPFLPAELVAQIRRFLPKAGEAD